MRNCPTFATSFAAFSEARPDLTQLAGKLLMKMDNSSYVSTPSRPYARSKYEKCVNRISVGRLYAMARALGVDIGYFYEGLGSGEPARPTARQRQTLELARSFAVLPRRQQEALAEMVRA